MKMNGTIHHLFILSLLSFFVFNTSANCDYSTKCTCDGGQPQGQYCGIDFVDLNCIWDHVYECNPQGKACDYGVRGSCHDCGCLHCPC
ncbi:hypothetical protein RhiirA4_545214 [Rhizophagus irregularis]|uniref:Uncharacterized protein n=1 Tax=Rhizophagus irregularis TaxID=588596 RepID=A0A2I1GRU8_9GLOM|nr:hypothetical protein RhiirA4_545214 [Rhizophagus irregularis]